MFVTADVPRNGGSGGQIVSYRLVRAYAQLGTVDVAALVPPGAEPTSELRESARRIALVPMPHFEAVAARGRNSLLFARSLAQGIPFRQLKFKSRPLARLISDWAGAERYDALHCDHLSTAPYRELMPAAPAVLAEHNVEWEQFSQLAARSRNPVVRRALLADSRRSRAWEAKALGRFGHILALTQEDRDTLAAERPDAAARISVWPVPVDPRPLIRRIDGPPTFLALGSLRSAGRAGGLRWFLEAVWPEARTRMPDARLDIVGGHPPADIRRRDGGDGIAVRGFVDDLEPVLARVDACVIPLFVAGGIRVKLLELIGRGIPCIGTPLAFRGLGQLEGRLEASSVEEWVYALTRSRTSSAEIRAAAAREAANLCAVRTPELGAECLRHALKAAGA